MDNNFKWFALRVRSRCEKVTATDLANRGYEVCSACAPQRRVWADRIRTVEMAMFPGYIFARFDPSNARDVLTSAELISVVGFGNGYCPVEESEMEALRRVLQSGVEVQREPAMHVGKRVRVCYGPLRGLEGVLVQVKNRNRLVISVSLLQRSVAVEVDDLIEPVSTSSTSSASTSSQAVA